MEEQETKTSSAVDLLRNIGVVVGGLASVAGGLGGFYGLFHWIGNTVIVARLREYNLYGIVRYTDEYVTEAGYQFFHDIFACFQNPTLVLFSLAILTLVIFAIPIGPFSRQGKKVKFFASGRLNRVFNGILWIRRAGIHYFIFALLAGVLSILLLMNWAEWTLARNVHKQFRVLFEAKTKMEDRQLPFALKKDGATPLIQQIFYNSNLKHRIFFNDLININLYNTIFTFWLSESLSDLDYPCPHEHLRDVMDVYQKEMKIDESPDLGSKAQFEKSKTAPVLLGNLLQKKINVRLYEAVRNALYHLEVEMGKLKGEESNNAFTIFAINPSYYHNLNDLLIRIKELRGDLLSFFTPEGGGKEIMDELGNIEKLSVGSHILSCSFWVLIGLLVYLVVNIPKVLHFKHWEMGYFLLMLILFLTIAINLPSTYGRYIFELKIQKVNKIIFPGEGKEGKKTEAPKSIMQEEIDKLLDQKRLYILGPTKGKEIILGAITDRKDPEYGIPKIIMLDRETYKYINVEPAAEETVSDIVRILRRQGRFLRGEVK
jgi:hypothetical protein